MLSTKRPTPTTVLYTISTRSPLTSISLRLRTTFSLLLRLAAGFLVFTILLYEYQHSRFSTLLPPLERFSNALLTTHPGSLTLPLLEATSRPYRLVFSAVATYLTLRRFHTSESLLVIRGLGVQTSTSSPYYVGTSSTRFIPTSSIQDIFIHEAFKGFEVRYYLCIVVEGEEGVVVVFPKILPRLEVLEDVWRGARACLYEPKT